ncbi:uncharacterized protein LOC121302095 [Polyodon spathula]|uniref:uncharacterized protein LOC121302095 n=1 Tax=Polyodon spathula TaxID=7913 RepID=UPI001B7EDC78|nr:uncharacterized protein LOC121302095 [Polyodon spathula]
MSQKKDLHEGVSVKTLVERWQNLTPNQRSSPVVAYRVNISQEQPQKRKESERREKDMEEVPGAASNLPSEYQYTCSICLDVFKNPVTTPCGHNFCEGCIERCWGESTICKCPLCKKQFRKIPYLTVNRGFAEIVEELWKMRASGSGNILPEPVPCDVCTGKKLPAAKSCLVCLVSYCESHIKPHFDREAFRNHQLVEPVANLENKVCSEHRRLLELFCKTDQTCICLLCSNREHRSHNVVSTEMERGERQRTLQAGIKTMISKKENQLETLKPTLKKIKGSEQREIKESEKLLDELSRSIEKIRDDLNALIRKKWQESANQVDRHTRQLEKDINELKENDSALEEISKTEDHISFLQRTQAMCLPAGDSPRIRTFSLKEAAKSLSKLKDSLEDFRVKELVELSKRVDKIMDPGMAHYNPTFYEDVKILILGDALQSTDVWLDGGGIANLNSLARTTSSCIKNRTLYSVWLVLTCFSSLYRRMKTRSQGMIFLVFLSFLAAVSTNRETVIGSAQPIIAGARQETTLPCLVSPPLSTLRLEVKWFRSSLASPVHFYKDLSDQTATQDSDYRGRTSLFESELAKGNLSLSLRNLRPSDSGIYSCFASNGTWSAEAKMELVIRALGTQPSVSMDSIQGEQTRLVCRSEGWSPEPEVIWRDRDGNDVTSLSSTTVERNKQGYLRIRSYINVEPQREGFSCLVRFKQPDPEPDTKPQSPSSFLPGVSGWVVAASVMVALGIATVPPLLIQWKETQRQNEWKVNERSLYPPESESSTAHTMELMYAGKPVPKSDCKLICSPDGATPVTNSEWKQICSSAVDVTLDPNTAHPLLILSRDGKHVRWEEQQQGFPDNPERFDWWRSVLGKEGFTSGRHYWEVEVGENRRWILGVSRESIHRKGVMRWSPEEGYWAVGRDGEPFLALTDPPAPLASKQALRKVGVYLDYEKKQLSFYNAETRSLICTLADNFSGKLYPIFFTLDGKTDLVIVPPAGTVQ